MGGYLRSSSTRRSCAATRAGSVLTTMLGNLSTSASPSISSFWRGWSSHPGSGLGVARRPPRQQLCARRAAARPRPSSACGPGVHPYRLTLRLRQPVVATQLGEATHRAALVGRSRDAGGRDPSSSLCEGASAAGSRDVAGSHWARAPARCRVSSRAGRMPPPRCTPSAARVARHAPGRSASAAAWTVGRYAARSHIRVVANALQRAGPEFGSWSRHSCAEQSKS